mgnify:FL=1
MIKKMRFVKKSLPKALVTGIALLVGTAGFNAAQAVPTMQIYLEGGVYNPLTETWVASAANGPARLWVIGTPGNKGAITDVKLVAGYSSANGAGAVSISATSSTTGGFGGFTDPSTPGAPTALGEDTSETSPLLNSGEELDRPNRLLPAHGIYGSGVFFQEFDIGDFTLVDSPTGDFINGFPTGTLTDQSQINVYEIAVAGITSGTVHFDVYGTQAGKDVFAPFSHDGETGGGLITTTEVPEPGTLLVLGLGLTGLGMMRRRRKAA